MPEYGLGGWIKNVLGIEDQPRPREIPAYGLPMPTNIFGGGVTGAPTMGGGSVMNPVAAVPQATQQTQQPVPQPQEDPLDRFERIARLMDLGERVGSAFDKGDRQVISASGGLGQPQLPNPNFYGLRL